jgi:DNA-binding winged helix-turn-helix (wHTH) protein/TolB-like protein/Tfp pilus assembly protein PilF
MDRLSQQKLVFNEFTLDLARGCLFRNGEEIKLRPKSFDTLKHLVENNGRLISKDELFATVWPDTAVTDDSLVQCLIEVRRALGENGQQLIKTVPRRGYIFEADVIRNDSSPTQVIYTDEVEALSVTIEEEGEEDDGESATQKLSSAPTKWSWMPSRTALAAAALLVIALGGLIVWQVRRNQSRTTITEIKTLAVLPFKSQLPESQNDYLGLGIANEIITKMSQTGALNIRPTSSVRKYANQEVDALEAARDLQVDAVLDGTYLRLGNQLRITVNLLRVADGKSLWAETFDQQFTEIFAIQDRVSQQVAQRLLLRLNSTAQERLTKRYTSNPMAYSYYAKAMYHFYDISPTANSRSDSDLAVDLFKKAIELDSQYALAHAQLGYTYTKIAVFQEDNPALIEQAKLELGIAERIDPRLAEVHLARFFIAFSQYEGWSVNKAMRELSLAQQLDPNVGHAQMLDLCSHIGLEEQTTGALNQALKIDPNNEEAKTVYINALLIAARPDDALEASRKLLNREPDVRYLVEKRMVAEAEQQLEQEYKRDPSAFWKFVSQVLLKALQGKHEEAEALVPVIISKERSYRAYHHDTYNIARIYALGGKSQQALKWLRTTVAEGFPHYPLFARDTFLDPIRDDPSFKQFLADMKQRWEGYVREFDSNAQTRPVRN